VARLSVVAGVDLVGSIDRWGQCRCGEEELCGEEHGEEDKDAGDMGRSGVGPLSAARLRVAVSVVGPRWTRARGRNGALFPRGNVSVFPLLIQPEHEWAPP
jgi:hypothetical protein